MPKVDWSGNTKSAPRWAGDFGGREHIMPFPARLAAAQFNKPDAVVVTVGAAGALAAAEEVPVDALSGPIPSGTVLSFGGDKFARLTANAAKGVVALAVAALPTALVDDDTATYPGAATSVKTVPSGTPVGRTFAERDAKAAFGPADANDDEFFLSYFDVYDADKEADVELYRPGSLVKENYLPNWDMLSDALKAKIRAVYRCITGTD